MKRSLAMLCGCVMLALPVLAAESWTVGARNSGATVLHALFSAATGAVEARTVRTLEWDDLIPAEFSFEELLKDYDVDNLADDDPRALELYDKLMEMWKYAPVVDELDGQAVRLPGFVVPLEGDGRTTREFLLVPYYGACIHVPPPPANQTVHVVVEGAAARIRGLFDTVWVTGVIEVTHTSSELAEAGYRIRAMQVAPYDE